MSRYINIVKTNSSDISKDVLKKLKFKKSKIKLIIGYISPYCDFDKCSKIIKDFFGENINVVLSTTAGELCNFTNSCEDSIYLPTQNNWDSIVLQSFGSDMIKDVNILSIDLGDNINSDGTDKGVSQRVEEISQNIKNTNIPTNIDYKDTFAFTLIDGLSRSESFFIEAIYKTGLMPCNIIGGSAGGKLDFDNTFIFDNTKVVQNKAVMVFVKLKKSIRFGIFKSDNFVSTNESFFVTDANPIQRYIKTVKRAKNSKSENIIDYLCSIFGCNEDVLEEKLLKFAFGIKIEDEHFIRSIASIDFKNRVVYFYCDIDFADRIYLFKTKDFVKTTDEEFRKFLEDKPSKPIAGLLNDCVLRRLFNSSQIDKLHSFDNIPLIGFSTFGELLGVNINQTLTSIFFFKVKKNEKFADKYVDNFIVKYASFKSFFSKRKVNQLNSTELEKGYKKLEKLNQELEKRVSHQLEELRQKDNMMLQNSKLSIMGEMIAMIAHQWKQPLAAQRAVVGGIKLKGRLSKLSDEYVLQNVEQIDKLCVYMADTIDDFSDFFKPTKDKKQTNIKELIEETTTLTSGMYKNNEVYLSIDIKDDVSLEVYDNEFKQVLLNLLSNAKDAIVSNSAENRYVTIEAYTIYDKLIVTVSDCAGGIPVHAIEKVFEPYFSTKSKNGTGLGLYMSKIIIEEHLDGKLNVKNIDGGAKFTIEIPVMCHIS
jgi:signal transduction histidine kinase